MRKERLKDDMHDIHNMEEKILSVAEKQFLQNGYSLTSTTQIAKEVGCNQALVHYYFRTKEKLFHAVLGGKIKRVFKEFISLETGNGNFTEKLTRLIEAHYDAVMENSNIVLFLMNGFTKNSQMFEELLSGIGDIPRQTLNVFEKELKEEIDAGRIRPISVQQLILNVVSLNVFAVAIRPAFAKIWNFSDKDMDALLAERKAEVVKTILLSLRP